MNKELEEFKKEISEKLEKYKNTETKWKTLQTILIALLLAILSYLLSNVFDRFIGVEHRLTELETKFDICVDCLKDQQQNFDGFNWEVYKGFDFDENNKVNLGLEIDILTEQYRWDCGSIDEIVRGGKKVDFDQIIQGYSSERYLTGVTELICLGTASTEGSIGEEEARAEDRMETLINLVKDNLESDEIAIYGLNIGQYLDNYNGLCSDQTLWQRRVIILKVIEEKFNLSQREKVKALVRILLNKSRSEIEFPISIKEYSKYKSRDLKFRHGRIK